mgnify:CR=1 FL=1
MDKLWIWVKSLFATRYKITVSFNSEYGDNDDRTYITKKVLIQKIPAALNWVSDLAESAQSEAVRLGAIKDILDRAGMKPVEKVEQTNIEKLSTKELERELSSLLKH